MKKFCGAVLLLAILGSATISFAQSVPLRSGEHDSFSRLVFASDKGRNWQILRKSGTARIRFSDPLPPLDITKVFDLIPRARVGSVQTTENEIILSLACDCDIEIFQIESGHVVIDVLDESERFPSSVTRKNSVSLDVPLRRLPLLPLISDLQAVHSRDESAHSEAPIAKLGEPAFERSEEVPLQVQFRADGMVPLLLDGDGGAEANDPTCAFEAFADAILMSDPNEAVAQLPSIGTDLVDGRDAIDARQALAVAENYLKAGWGAEARLVLLSQEIESSFHFEIAAALDGLSTPDDAVADPGCGPASTVVALLSDPSSGNFSRVDDRALSRFLDRLPPARWTDIGDRFEHALTMRGEMNTLSKRIGGKLTLSEHSNEEGYGSAGTDLAAFEAIKDDLDHANAAGEVLGPIEVGNALAVLRSVPNEALQDDIRFQLALQLVRGRYLHDAVSLIADEPERIEELLKFATDELEEEELIELAVRLLPHLMPGNSDAERLGDILRHRGLLNIADRFYRTAAPGSIDSLDRNGPVARMVEPWQTRDFRGVIAQGKEDDARVTIAGLIIARNEATAMTSGDLENARKILDRSRETSAAVRALISE